VYKALIGIAGILAAAFLLAVAVHLFPDHMTVVTNGMDRPVRVTLCGYGVDAVVLSPGGSVELNMLPWESACAVYSGDGGDRYTGCLAVGDRDRVVISDQSLRQDADLNHC
jgi:hypothetical protein